MTIDRQNCPYASKGDVYKSVNSKEEQNSNSRALDLKCFLVLLILDFFCKKKTTDFKM